MAIGNTKFVTTKTGPGGSELATQLAQALAGDRRGLTRAAKTFDRAKNYALGSSAKFYREEMKRTFEDNLFGWDRPAQYSNWLGLGAKVQVKGVIKANRPSNNRFTKTGRVKKAYQSAKPPKRVYEIGGKLRGAAYSKVSESANNFQAGMFRNNKTEAVFRQFQEDGPVKKGGNLNSMRRYFAAIGMPIRGGAFPQRKGRKLIDPLAGKYNPQDIYQERYLKRINK